MGGRITFIKAALSKIPIYYMSLFKMPAKITFRVERFQRDFLWEEGLKKKDHLVGWKLVCPLKKEGGLGIDRIKERNMVLMDKWLWRFSTKRDSLWHSTISQKYDRDSLHSPSASWSILWKNIFKLKPLFSLFTRFALGNGRSTKFWKDLWWGESTLASLYPRLFLISIQKEVKVADILSNSEHGPL